MSEAKLFFGGLPTGPDVKKLIDEYGTPEEGAFFKYDDLATKLDIPRSENRFITVTNAWRRELERENNLVIVAIRGEGFRVLDAKGRLKDSEAHVISGGKKVRKGTVRARRTDRSKLSKADQLKLDHVSRVGVLMLNEAQEFVPALPRVNRPLNVVPNKEDNR